MFCILTSVSVKILLFYEYPDVLFCAYPELYCESACLSMCVRVHLRLKQLVCWIPCIVRFYVPCMTVLMYSFTFKSVLHRIGSAAFESGAFLLRLTRFSETTILRRCRPLTKRPFVKGGCHLPQPRAPSIRQRDRLALRITPPIRVPPFHPQVHGYWIKWLAVITWLLD